METLLHDLRFGLRLLLKKPGFTAVAVIALALGIGANTASFSVVNAVLLQALPYPAPEQLVAVKSVNAKAGETEFGGSSPADFLDWKAQTQSFAFLTGQSGGGVTLTGGDQPEAFFGARVSDDFFSVYGIKPMLGRTFAPEEFTSAGPATVVLSHSLWQRRFGGDPKIIGQSLPLDGKSVTVIGVMPPDFKQPPAAEVWTPLSRDSGEMQLRGNRYFSITGRLKPGVTLAQAQAELSTIAGRLAEQYTASNTDWGVRLVPLKEHVVQKIRPALMILLGAVGVVLLIACANVANLLLAQATRRHREVAVRAALGASRGRLLRQLLTESVLLSLLGGVAGLLLALWGVDVLVALIPESMNFPRLAEIRVDTAVLGFTFGVALLTGLLFGLAPGLQATKPDLTEALKESGRTGSRFQLTQMRSLLVVSEVALTLLLLIGAGLLLRSFLGLQATNPGFDPKHLLTLYIGAPMPQYADPQQRAGYFQQIQERLAAVPGVQAATATSGPPLTGVHLVFPFIIEGRAAETGDVPQTVYSSVSPNYFQSMKIPLLAGREFSEHDRRGATHVVIINETMARRFFAEQNPLGQRLRIDYLSRPVSLEIIGVVSDSQQGSLADQPEIEIFVSNLQFPWFATAFVVRTEPPPESLSLALQRAIWSLDKNRAITMVKTMDQLLAESVAQPRLYTVLLSLFALIALVLATVGLYGVMSYAVAQRTHEIGVRLALGAQSRDVLKLVVRQGLTLALVGVGIGLVGALVLTRVLSSLLYGVSATDAVTFISIAGLLLAVAALACYLPARRATRVDPMIALRYE